MPRVSARLVTEQGVERPVNGSRVMFNDSSSGSRMTLKRAGDTLYGITIDPATKRVTVAVELHKVHTGHEAP